MRILNTNIFSLTQGFNYFLTYCQCENNLVKNLKVKSRFQFTREIALNDKYLSKCFPDRKVLSMTLEQLLGIFN